MSNIECKHTFAICAYKESPYLEDCICSLKNQTVKSKIIMATSTPCDYISGLAEKYDIPLFVREGKSDIRDDWNFAYDHADTPWVTIAHQDDMYNKKYAEKLDKQISKLSDAIAFITDYVPIKHGKVEGRDINSTLRRLLRLPLKSNFLNGRKFWKKAVLSLGNSICCPSVSYNKELLGPSFFTSELKFNIDWDTFYKLAEMDGRMLYTDKVLTYYRVHDGATSKKWIENHMREADDLHMFKKFWPEWMAKGIMFFYKKAYDTYD